jgi:hypothetical protein
VSRESEIDKLTEVIRSFERMLVKGALPDMPIIRQLDDGSDDNERFLKDYGCTIAQASERGATSFIVRTNFRNPHVELQRGPFARERSDYFPPPTPQAPKPATLSDEDAADALKVAPDAEPAPDSLVDSLLSHARDMAALRDKQRAKNAGN